MNPSNQNTLSPPALLAALRTHWKLKLGILAGLGVFFSLVYFTLQHVELFERRELRWTVVDHWAGFEPGWAWVYASLYLLMPVSPWLATERLALRRFACGWISFYLVSFAIFVAFPVDCPRPEETTGVWLYNQLITVDTRGNSFPSLHCSLAAFSVLFGHRTLSLRLSRLQNLAVFTPAWIWTLLICHSTLAIKQHYFVDVVLGLALAFLSDWWVWRGSALRRSKRGRIRAGR